MREEGWRRARGVGAEEYSAKRSSDRRVAYPEVKIQVRDLVLVVGLPPLPHEVGGSQYSG